MTDFSPATVLHQSLSCSSFKSLMTVAGEIPDVDEIAEYQICSYPRNGFEIYLNQAGLIQSVILHGQSKDGHDTFKGPQPNGIPFSCSLDSIKVRFGTPTKSGVEKSTHMPWIRYDNELYSLHLQFNKELSRISLITIMAAEVSQGRI